MRYYIVISRHSQAQNKSAYMAMNEQQRARHYNEVQRQLFKDTNLFCDNNFMTTTSVDKHGHTDTRHHLHQSIQHNNMANARTRTTKIYFHLPADGSEKGSMAVFPPAVNLTSSLSDDSTPWLLGSEAL